MSEPVYERFDLPLATDRSPELIRHTLNVDYTGLPYATPEVRRYLIETIDAAKSKGLPIAFIDADMNELKPINDELGHQKGNEAITTWVNKTRERIMSVPSINALLYRPQAGGDELKILLILGSEKKEEAKKTLIEIQKALTMETEFAGRKLTASFGIEFREPGDSSNPGETFQNLELKAEEGKDDMKLGRIIRKVDDTIKSGRKLLLPEYIERIEEEWYERRMPRNVINRIIEHCLAKRIIMDLPPESPASYED